MTTSEHTHLQNIFLEACQKRPQDRSAYLDRACAQDTDLREQVESLLAADADSNGILEEAMSSGGPKVLAEAMAAHGDFDERTTQLPDQIGSYRILSELGRGGMGVVYEAEQISPRRRVALKVVRSSMITKDLTHRFRHEWQVLGLLRHPGIAQIYEAGTAVSNGVHEPFFAMELVEGETILKHADSHAMDIPARLELLARLCDIIHYAHQKGVIHRDLKPGNILVSDEDSSSTEREPPTAGTNSQLKVLDFGIARITDMDLHTVTVQTNLGQLVGTVPYMSPEQAAGDPDGIDARSDVYALGLIACELLSGRLPYDVRGKMVHEAVRIIQEDDPSSLSVANPALRGEIETIVLMAIEKDRERRYQTAAELAADIRRYLRNEPINARPASAWYQTRKFANRNRPLVAGVLATMVVSLIGTVVASRYAIVASRYAFINSRHADEMERASYVSGIAAAMSAIEQHDISTANAYLDRTPESHRGWEYDYLRSRLVGHVNEWSAPEPIKTSVTIDPKSGLMHAMMIDSKRGLWERGTWSFAGGPPIQTRTLGTDLAATSGIVADARSMRYAARNALGDIVIGALIDPEQLRVIFQSRTNRANPIAWNHDAEGLIFTDKQTWIWDGETSRVLADYPATSASFLHTGSRVALTFKDTITLYDTESGDKLASVRFNDHVTGLSFSPDDRTLAATGVYRNVYLLDADSLELTARLEGHQDFVFPPAWSADGAWLATVSADGTLRIWDPESRTQISVYDTGMETLPVSVGIHSDQVLVAGERIRSYPLRDPAVLAGHESYIYHLAFSPDGTMLGSSGYLESEIRLWDVHTRSLITTLPAPHTLPMGLEIDAAPNIQFSADSTRLVVGTTRSVSQWDISTKNPLAASTNPDWKEAFLETLDRRSLVRLSPTEVLGPNPGSTPDQILGGWPKVSAASILIRNDGKRVAIAQLDGDVSVFTEGSTIPIGVLKGHRGIAYCVAFSPDGSRLATGGNDNTVRIWDAETFEQLLVLRGHTSYVKDLVFSPDGTILASASGDRTIRLWDASPQ